MFVWRPFWTKGKLLSHALVYEHECVHAPAAAEVYELGMGSVLPTAFVPALKKDGFVGPVLHYAYKICISKPVFRFHKINLHDWL